MRLSHNRIKESNDSAWILNLYADLTMAAKLGIKMDVKLEPWLLEAFFHIEDTARKLKEKNGKPK